MAATATLLDPRTRQLAAYLADPRKKRLETRARQLREAADRRKAELQALVDYLQGEHSPAATAKLTEVTNELVSLYKLAESASDKLRRYIDTHPLESY